MVIDATWVSIGVGVLTLTWLGSLIDLCLAIRRERLKGSAV
jgi:hypothetical protein